MWLTESPDPTISMATFFAGLSTFPRTVLYIVAQTIGGVLAGYWLKLGLNDDYYPKVSTHLHCSHNQT
jgi:glycerol uptake facilitator-like aquaporin